MRTADIIAIWIAGITLFITVLAAGISLMLRQNLLQVHAGQPKLVFNYGKTHDQIVQLWVSIENEPITEGILYWLGVHRQPANFSVRMATEKLDGSLSKTESEWLHHSPGIEIRAGYPVRLPVIQYRQLPPKYADMPFTGADEEEHSHTDYLSDGEYNLYLNIHDAVHKKSWKQVKRFGVRKTDIYWID